jgi:hypothetical protein
MTKRAVVAAAACSEVTAKKGLQGRPVHCAVVYVVADSDWHEPSSFSI